MPYRIAASEHPGLAVRRIAGEQAAKALEEIRRDAAPVGWRIHQVRRRCKKIRAAARLVRPQFAQYKDVNRRFRDIAHRLSEHRDARVAAELVTELSAPDAGAPATGHPAVRWFGNICELAEEHGETVLAEVEPALASAAGDIESWHVDEIGMADVIEGLRITLSRAYEGYLSVSGKASEQVWHEWRKRCTYHSLHSRLLRQVLPENERGRHKSFARLGSLIGEEHDCSVSIGDMRTMPEFMSRRAQVRDLLSAAKKRRRALRKRCRHVARNMFNESPEAFCERVKAHWEAVMSGQHDV